jgi:hypothetical protein
MLEHPTFLCSDLEVIMPDVDLRMVTNKRRPVLHHLAGSVPVLAFSCMKTCTRDLRLLM